MPEINPCQQRVIDQITERRRTEDFVMSETRNGIAAVSIGAFFGYSPSGERLQEFISVIHKRSAQRGGGRIGIIPRWGMNA